MLEKILLNIVTSGHWAIDETYGLNQLSKLIYNLEAKNDIPLIKLSSKTVTANEDGTVTSYTQGNIAIIEYSGVMTVEDQWCSEGIKSLSNNLYSLYADKNIKGILLDLDSGGGEESAGILLKNTLQDKTKPVVVHTPFLGSAAVMGTLTATEIVAASDAARIGSIGVFANLNKKYLAEHKEIIESVYSDLSPNKNKALRDLLEGDNTELKKELNEAAQLFQSEVKKYRELKGDKETIKETLSGGMFLAQDAKRRGLIDMIGTRKTALKRLIRNI